LLTASGLGAGIYSDLFFVAFKLPNLFRRLFGEGAFTQAFLPSFTAARKKGIFAATVLIKFSILNLTSNLKDEIVKFKKANLTSNFRQIRLCFQK